MNQYSIESFNQWCDNVTIAEEARMININSAKTVSDVPSLMTAMNAKCPLIKLSGENKAKALEFFNEKKNDFLAGSIWLFAGLFLFWPLLAAGISQRLHDREYYTIMNYKLAKNTINNEIYIVRKGYKLESFLMINSKII